MIETGERAQWIEDSTTETGDLKLGTVEKTAGIGDAKRMIHLLDLKEIKIGIQLGVIQIDHDPDHLHGRTSPH